MGSPGCRDAATPRVRRARLLARRPRWPRAGRLRNGAITLPRGAPPRDERSRRRVPRLLAQLPTPPPQHRTRPPVTRAGTGLLLTSDFSARLRLSEVAMRRLGRSEPHQFADFRG